MNLNKTQKKQIKGNFYHLIDQYPKLKKLTELLEQLEGVGNQEMISQCNDEIGESLFGFGEFDAALSHFKEQQSSYQAKDDIEKDYYFRIKIAKTLFQKGFTEAALDKLFEVLAFNSEELNAYAHNYLALICINQGEMIKGESYLLRSIEVHTRFAKKERLSENKIVRGKYHQIEGDYVRALQYFNESLLLSRSVENSYLESYLLMSCAELFMEINHFKEATRIYRDAFHIADKEQYTFIYIKSRIGFGESLMKDGNTFLAQQILKETTSLSKDKKYHNLQLQSLEGLQACYRKEGLIKQSKENHRLIEALMLKIKFEKESVVVDIIEEKEKELKALLVKQRALVEQQKDMDQLRYVLAHDLKEPLRNIGNYAGLIRKRYKDAIGQDGADYVDIINQATKKLDNLMTGLLSYLTVGVLEVNFEQLNTNTLLFDAIRGIENLIGKSQANIELNAPEYIYADASSIKEVFSELLLNSIKFAKKDVPPIIKINFETTKEKTIFKIEDNGIGIENAYLEKIKKLFYRLDRTSDDSSIGLGLAKCKKIIQLHGGTIDIQSEYREGTTVVFSLNNYK